MISLRRVIRTVLQPAIAPLRTAVDRRVTTLLDARLRAASSEVRPGEVIDTAIACQFMDHLASRLTLVDEQSHPTTDDLWVLLRDLENAKLTIKFFDPGSERLPRSVTGPTATDRLIGFEFFLTRLRPS